MYSIQLQLATQHIHHHRDRWSAKVITFYNSIYFNVFCKNNNVHTLVYVVPTPSLNFHTTFADDKDGETSTWNCDGINLVTCHFASSRIYLLLYVFGSGLREMRARLRWRNVYVGYLHEITCALGHEITCTFRHKITCTLGHEITCTLGHEITCTLGTK